MHLFPHKTDKDPIHFSPLAPIEEVPTPKEEIMEPPLPENSSTNRSLAIRELTRGSEFATELQNLLRKPAGDLESETAGELVTKIMQSFADTISIMNSGDTHRNSHDPAITRVSARGPDENMIKNSDENMKTPAGKDRRRGYKRR